MRISGSWEPEEVNQTAIDRGVGLLETAYENGYTFFDHADIYGSGTCEEIFGVFIKKHPDWRKHLQIATKCGILFQGEPTPESPGRYDFSAGHILRSADASLKRLQIETIDLYQLHRPDFLANPDEIAEAFAKLKESGKVRYFGVSNFRPTLVSAVQSRLSFPLVSNQIEFHLLRLDPLEDGVLDQCLEKKMSPMAWSPLAQGRLGEGRTVRDDHRLMAVHTALDREAKRLGVTRDILALAWVLLHPSQVIPIVGSTKPDRIKESVKALDLKMDRETWYRLLIASRGSRLP